MHFVRVRRILTGVGAAAGDELFLLLDSSTADWELVGGYGRGRAAKLARISPQATEYSLFRRCNKCTPVRAPVQRAMNRLPGRAGLPGQ